MSRTHLFDRAEQASHENVVIPVPSRLCQKVTTASKPYRVFLLKVFPYMRRRWLQDEV